MQRELQRGTLGEALQGRQTLQEGGREKGRQCQVRNLKHTAAAAVAAAADVLHTGAVALETGLGLQTTF